MNQFLRAQFDKLLLMALLCFMLSLLVHLIHCESTGAAAAAAWIEKSIDLITGGLLGIVTGRAVGPPKSGA